MDKQITIEEKTYQEIPESFECDGCAAQSRYELCRKLPECKDVVFKEVEVEK